MPKYEQKPCSEARLLQYPTKGMRARIIVAWANQDSDDGGGDVTGVSVFGAVICMTDTDSDVDCLPVLSINTLLSLSQLNT